VQKSGAWFSYGEHRLGQGREKARAYLEENPKMLAEIREQVLAARGFGNTAPKAAGTATDAE
jgi:recombination protein RecA